MTVAADTNVFPRLLDLDYPVIARGEGVRLYTDDGFEVLDACSGGAMVACLGHGATEIVQAAREQAQRISYVYNHHFTNEPQERLARSPARGRAPEMARVRFVVGRIGGERDARSGSFASTTSIAASRSGGGSSPRRRPTTAR